jgi:hypothetical protein
LHVSVTFYLIINHYPNLPRDADNIISGYLEFVATCVTQPLWPLRVPRNSKDSDIFLQLLISKCTKIHDHNHKSHTQFTDSCSNSLYGPIYNPHLPHDGARCVMEISVPKILHSAALVRVIRGWKLRSKYVA